MLESMILERAAARIQAEDREREWHDRATKAESELARVIVEAATLTKKWANYASMAAGAIPPFPELLPPPPPPEEAGDGRVTIRSSIRYRQMQEVANSRMEAAKRRREIAEQLEQD